MTTNPRLKEGFMGRIQSPVLDGDGSTSTTSPFFINYQHIETLTSTLTKSKRNLVVAFKKMKMEVR